MGLKADIKSAFENNVDNEGTLEDVAKLLTDAYIGSIGKDQIQNTPVGPIAKVIEQSIISQFNLAFQTESYLQFTLIESGLVTAWTGSQITLPATPPPGFSIVANATVTASTPVGTPPLSDVTDSYDNIVDSFFNLFKNHANTIKILYTGTSTSAPPAPITFNASGVSII